MNRLQEIETRIPEIRWAIEMMANNGVVDGTGYSSMNDALDELQSACYELGRLTSELVAAPTA